MDKRKIFLYGGVAAASLAALYLLTRSGSSATQTSDQSAGYYNPAILYTAGMGGGSDSMNLPEVVPSQTSGGSDLEGALELAMAQIISQGRQHANDNATGLFNSLTATLAQLGGGQTVGSFFTQDGNTLVNLTTKLFNPQTVVPGATPVAPPELPPTPRVLNLSNDALVDTGRGGFLEEQAMKKLGQVYTFLGAN